MQEDATFHSTLFRTPKSVENLKNILNKLQKKRTVHVLHQTAVSRLDYWRRLQHTFRCFWTKTRHAAGRMKSFRKGHMTCRMLSVKKRLLSPLFCTKYLISCRDVRCFNNIKWLGKYSSDFVQNFAGKNEYCCVVQMHGLKHMRRYLQGKHSRSVDWKYNSRKCWCYPYKMMFSGYKSVIVSPCACCLFVSKVTIYCVLSIHSFMQVHNISNKNSFQ